MTTPVKEYDMKSAKKFLAGVGPVDTTAQRPPKRRILRQSLVKFSAIRQVLLQKFVLFDTKPARYPGILNSVNRP